MISSTTCQQAATTLRRLTEFTWLKNAKTTGDLKKKKKHLLPTLDLSQHRIMEGFCFNCNLNTTFKLKPRLAGHGVFLPSVP